LIIENIQYAFKLTRPRSRLTSFIIILLMVSAVASAVASVLVNATGPKAGDPLSYTTGTE